MIGYVLSCLLAIGLVALLGAVALVLCRLAERAIVERAIDTPREPARSVSPDPLPGDWPRP